MKSDWTKNINASNSLGAQMLLIVLIPTMAGLFIFAATAIWFVMQSGARFTFGSTLFAGVAALITLAVAVYGSFQLADRYFIRQALSIISHLKSGSSDEIPVIIQNEIGQVAQWINKTDDTVRLTIADIASTIQALNSSISQIASAISAQAAISAQQSAAIAEITSTVEELSASSTQIAEHSTSVVDVASETWANTTRGAESIDTIITQMGEIKNDTENSISEVLALGKKSKEITSIMGIINNIADQTKLIAFNAALEASSAGEYGKRFGVVAVEIRRLADSVMESTDEIEGKINEIQESINRLVIASEKSAKIVQNGMNHSSNTAEILVDIVTAAQTTTDAAKQISLSTQQQKTASNQVVFALRDIVAGANQTSLAISNIDAISKDLMKKAAHLDQTITNLKV